MQWLWKTSVRGQGRGRSPTETLLEMRGEKMEGAYVPFDGRMGKAGIVTRPGNTQQLR